MFDNELFSGSE